MDNCPTCGLPAEWRCRCLLADSRCAADHRWHACPGCGKPAPGGGDHAADANSPVNLCAACSRKHRPEQPDETTP